MEIFGTTSFVSEWIVASKKENIWKSSSLYFDGSSASSSSFSFFFASTGGPRIVGEPRASVRRRPPGTNDLRRWTLISPPAPPCLPASAKSRENVSMRSLPAVSAMQFTNPWKFLFAKVRMPYFRIRKSRTNSWSVSCV